MLTYSINLFKTSCEEHLIQKTLLVCEHFNKKQSSSFPALTPESFPRIKKSKLIFGRTITLRDASVDDAEFILSLRINPGLNSFISPTDNDIHKQKEWIHNYVASNDQAYFVIFLDDNPLGTVRLYGADEHRFCWGSWILQKGAPAHVAIESALIIYTYALDHLFFREAYFDVRKNNRSVCLFHERFGAKKAFESQTDYHYTINEVAIRRALLRYSRFLQGPLVIVP